MKYLEKIQIVFIIFTASVLFAVGIHTFVNIFVPLSKIEKSEVNKSQVIGLISSSSMEFDENQKPFWWILKNGSEFNFTNYSDEPLKGLMNLKFENNPCNNLQFVELTSVSSNLKYEFTSPETSIKFETTFKKRETLNINIKTHQFSDCYIDNGDDRNFGTKLIFWSFS